MKLTTKQKQLVKEYAKKLQSKKLNEAEDATGESVFNSINWDMVSAEILSKFKIKTKLEFKLKSRGHTYHVEMISDNLISQCGIFKYAISECFIAFFSNELFTSSDTDHKLKFWGTIHLDYPGNGMNIGSISIDQDNKIVCRIDTPRTGY